MTPALDPLSPPRTLTNEGEGGVWALGGRRSGEYLVWSNSSSRLTRFQWGFQH